MKKLTNKLRFDRFAKAKERKELLRKQLDDNYETFKKTEKNPVDAMIHALEIYVSNIDKLPAKTAGKNSTKLKS